MKPASTLPRFLLPLLLCLVTVTVGGDDTPATASSIRVNGSANGTISPAGDVDYWRFNVPSAGQLVVETAGDTDTIGALEDSAGNLLQEHDDQDVNTNRNFKIERAVTAGVYYIRISAYRNSTGDYTLHVRHTPESGGGAGGGGAGPSGAQFAMSHALGDLNGDGRDDVLLRHTDGRWHYYPMNGPEFLAGQRGAAALTSNPDWQFAAIGDLNGDGKDDVLLRRVTDGRWYYYPMNGRRHLADQRGGANIISDLNWQLAGIGDLNGDGRDDVLLRHTDGRWLYYPMNGREYIAGRRATANLTRDLNWQVAGIGDLNGDGRDDVLLRHTDGRWHYYPMNGPEFLAGQRGAAALTSNPDWQFAAIGDLNGDGKDDVLLRRVTDGRWYYYPMNGRRHLADQRGGANIISDLNWQLAGIGDLNGDGRDDVLLRHTDGRWLYYPMNGREYIAGRRATANLTRDLSWGVITGTNASQGNQGGNNDDGDTDTGAPDLVVESPSVSDSTPAPGDTFSFNVRVRNQGDARSGSTTLRYYRSTNSTINSSDAQVSTDSVAGLSGGSNVSISETLVAPSSPGTYYYGACVDEVNGESNTSNNCSGGVRVAVEEEAGVGAPDLTLEHSSGAGPIEVTAGESFYYLVGVHNQGSGPSDPTTLRHYRSSDSTISSSDTQVRTDSIPGLQADELLAVELRLSVPSTAGTYYYGSCVDAVSGESNTRNNCSDGIRVTVSGDDTSGGDDHSNTRSGATSLSPNSSRAGRIDPGNDTDYFAVRVNNSGALTVYTAGNLDTIGELQSGSGSVLASDDDGGSGLNFRIEQALSAGTYYIKVESYRTNTGSYTLHADFNADGSGPDTVSSGLRVSLGSTCSDTIHLRFFEDRNDVTSSSAQWPGGGRVYVVREGESYQQSLGCTPGYKVCWGARNTRTNSYWGIDIDASKGCENCCTTCPSSSIREWNLGNLSCNGGGGGGGNGGDPVLVFRVEDACNDGYDFQYRFFEQSSGGSLTGRRYPGSGNVYVTGALGQSRSHRLNCSSSAGYCLGANRRGINETRYWGLGIDGDQGCTDCCYSCPTSGERTVGRRLICQ